MSRTFGGRSALSLERESALEMLTSNPKWVVVEDTDNVHCILNAGDLKAFLDEREDIVEGIELLRIPGERMDIVSIDSRATVQEAQDALSSADAEACIVRRLTAPMIRPVVGVITQADIAQYRKVME